MAGDVLGAFTPIGWWSSWTDGVQYLPGKSEADLPAGVTLDLWEVEDGIEDDDD